MAEFFVFLARSSAAGSRPGSTRWRSFFVFSSYKTTAKVKQPAAALQLCDSTKSGVRGEKNAVTHLSFPDAATRGKRFDFSFRRKAGREIEHFTAFPSHRPSRACHRLHHRTPSNGAPGCRGRRKLPAKQTPRTTAQAEKNTKGERKSQDSGVPSLKCCFETSPDGFVFRATSLCGKGYRRLATAMLICAPLHCAYSSPH